MTAVRVRIDVFASFAVAARAPLAVDRHKGWRAGSGDWASLLTKCCSPAHAA